MAIDFKTFNDIVDYVLDDNKPVMIRGRHGVGKSQVVYQTGKRRSLKVVERRTSQMTEGDLLGLPEILNGSTRWCAPDWLLECCNEPRLLFFDEVDRAIPEVRQGIMELTDSRKLNGYVLHPQTLIMSAVNGGEYGSNYQVGELDPAELDRWVVWDINPTVEDWLAWAKDGNINEVLVDFINQNRDHLEHLEDPEPNKVYPSRRSWHRLNDCLVKGKLLGKETTGVLFHLACGYVGMEAAVALKDFVQNYESVLTPERVLNGEWDKAAELSQHKGLALTSKMVDWCADNELTDEQVVNLANLVGVLPGELVMSLWSGLGQNTKASKVLDRLHQQEVNGVPFGVAVANLVSGS